MLTPKKVREIYRRSWDGESGRALAVEFGVSPSIVSRIRNGRQFAELTGHAPASAPRYPLTGKGRTKDDESAGSQQAEVYRTV